MALKVKKEEPLLILADVEAEAALLACLISRETGPQVESIPPELFTRTSHKDLLAAFRAFRKAHQGYPAPEVFYTFLDQHARDADKKAKLLTAYSRISKVEHDTANIDFYRNRLADLWEGRQLLTVGRSIQEGLGSGRDYKKLRSDILARLLQEGGAQDNVQWRGFVSDDVSERWREYNAKARGEAVVRAIPFGIEFLDQSTGGIAPGSLTCLYSGTSGGKSRTMISIAYNVAQQGKSVLYLSLEMSHTELKHCYDARAGMLDSALIRNAKLSDAERDKYKALLKAQKKIKPPFYMVDLPDQATVTDLYREVEIFRTRTGAFPDVVVIDYAGIMMPVRKFRDGRSEKYDLLFQELHNFTRRTAIPAITAVQESREANKKKGDTAETVDSIGLSHYIAPHCETIVHLRQSKEDALHSKLKMIIEKDRFGRRFVFSYVCFAPAWSYVGDWKIKMKGKKSQHGS